MTWDAGRRDDHLAGVAGVSTIDAVGSVLVAIAGRGIIGAMTDEVVTLRDLTEANRAEVELLDRRRREQIADHPPVDGVIGRIGLDGDHRRSLPSGETPTRWDDTKRSWSRTTLRTSSSRDATRTGHR
jgi:hypothetical protein